MVCILTVYLLQHTMGCRRLDYNSEAMDGADPVRLPQRRELGWSCCCYWNIPALPAAASGKQGIPGREWQSRGLVHWVAIKHLATPEAADRGLWKTFPLP